MWTRRLSIWIVSTFALIVPVVVESADPPPGPAYQIVLRSRHAVVTPSRCRDAQTGGGSIIVEQVEPHTIVVTMGGSAVAGSACHDSTAGIDFNLQQELDIIPVRAGVRPPRVGMVGRVVGTLQVTQPSCCWLCDNACGTAEQGPAIADLVTGEKSLVNLNVKSLSLSNGQESAINLQTGPVEAPAAVGKYQLIASYRIGVSQGKGVFNRQAAAADFDSAPQLDGAWADVLKPFRAIPRRDFGFKLVLRVVEATAP